MTEREKYLSKCLSDIFDYCREHNPYCEGCIFYNQTQFGPVVMGSCKVLNAPEVFGKGKTDE